MSVAERFQLRHEAEIFISEAEFFISASWPLFNLGKKYALRCAALASHPTLELRVRAPCLGLFLALRTTARFPIDPAACLRVRQPALVSPRRSPPLPAGPNARRARHPPGTAAAGWSGTARRHLSAALRDGTLPAMLCLGLHGVQSEPALGPAPGHQSSSSAPRRHRACWHPLPRSPRMSSPRPIGGAPLGGMPSDSRSSAAMAWRTFAARARAGQGRATGNLDPAVSAKPNHAPLRARPGRQLGRHPGRTGGQVTAGAIQAARARAGFWAGMAAQAVT